MASPQIENGYTKIANELLDALCVLQLSGQEWSVVHAIIRKTYGFNKKEDWITGTQIAIMTGLHRVRVSEAKNKLVAKNIVTENRNKISLNKDFETWGIVTENRNTVTENRNKLLRKTVHTKDNKDNIQKITDSKESGSRLKDNHEDMSWNKKSDDYEEGVVDLDGDGSVYDPLTEKKKKEQEQNARFRQAVDWLINHQGRDPKRTGIPKQLKAIRKLYTMGVSSNEAKQIIKECEGSPVWQGRAEKPDYWTVVSIIQKRG